MPKPKTNKKLRQSRATSSQSKRNTAWSDSDLRNALAKRLINKDTITDSLLGCPHLPQRTFEYWLSKFTTVEIEQVRSLPRSVAHEHLAQWILQQRLHEGHSYLTSTQCDNLVGMVLERDAANHPLVREQVLEAAQSFKIAALERWVPLPTRSWFTRFMNENSSKLAHKQIQTKTSARIAAEQNPDAIRQFIAELSALVAMFDINEACRSQIIAGDETGFASRPQKDSKYVVAKGRDSARVAERALIQHTSVMHLCDADGDSLAPMVMFKGKRLDATAMPDAPPDTVFQYQSKGYFEAKHFIEILRHIVRNHRIPESCKLTKMASDVQGKIDDSSSHLKTLETPVCHRILIVDNAPCHHHPLATAYAEEHWIHIVYLPPNLTHILQVSDLAVFASMKKFWYRIANTCTMVYSENFKFKPRTFWTFLKKAWEEGTKPANVIRGFLMAGQVKRLQPHKIVISSEQQNSNAPQQIERVGVAALANLSIDELNEKLAKLERLVELQTMLEKPKQSNKAKKFTAKSSRSRAQPFSSSSSSDSTSSDSESEPKPRRQQTNAHNRRSKPPKLVKRARSSSDIESNSEARRPKRPASRRKPSRPQSLSRLSPGDSSSSDQEPVVRSRQRGAALTSSTTSAASGLSLTQPVRRHKRARSATPPPSPRSASRTLHVSVKLTITPVSAVSASGPRSIRPKYQLAHSDNIGVIRLRRFHTSRRILGRFD